MQAQRCCLGCLAQVQAHAQLPSQWETLLLALGCLLDLHRPEVLLTLRGQRRADQLTNTHCRLELFLLESRGWRLTTCTGRLQGRCLHGRAGSAQVTGCETTSAHLASHRLQPAKLACSCLGS